jgi:hypothetical protein
MADTTRSLLRELLDREQIRDVQHRYALGLDRIDRALLEGCLTEDVEADYGPLGVFSGRKEFVDGLLAALAGQAPGATQHLLCNFLIDLDGDAARTHCYGHVPGLFERPNGPRVITVGVIYDADLRRTRDGWRIARLKAELRWMDDGWEMLREKYPDSVF